MEFKPILFGIIMITLFSFLLISFVVGGASRYERDTTELESRGINFSQFNKTLQGVQETSESWKTTYSGQKEVGEEGGLIYETIKSILTSMWAITVVPIVTIVMMMDRVLGIPSAVTGVIIFVVVVSLLLAAWKVLRQGR